MEVRGRRGRAEEEGGRSYRRRHATVPNLEGEAGAIVYIWFSGFAREEGEEEEKREKPTRSSRIGHRRESASSNLQRRTEDPMARNIWSDVDKASGSRYCSSTMEEPLEPQIPGFSGSLGLHVAFCCSFFCPAPCSREEHGWAAQCGVAGSRSRKS